MVLNYNNDLFLLPSGAIKVIFDYRHDVFLVKTAAQPQKITAMVPGETHQLTITAPELVWAHHLYKNSPHYDCKDNKCVECFEAPNFISAFRLFITTNDDKLTAYDLANISKDGVICWGKLKRPLYNLREANNKFWNAPFNMDYYNPTHSSLSSFCGRAEHVHNHDKYLLINNCDCCERKCDCTCPCIKGFLTHLQNYNQNSITSNPKIDVGTLLNLETSVGYGLAEGIFITRNSKAIPNIKFEDVIMIKNEETNKYEPLIIGAVFKQPNGWKMYINNNEYFINNKHINICAVDGRAPKEMSTFLLLENEFGIYAKKIKENWNFLKQFIKTY